MDEPTRDDAWDLVCEWVSSESLRKHVLGVEAAMRSYARRDDEDEELWGITGLVHDLDYAELRDRGYPEDLVEAVAGHAEYLNVPRTTRLAKTLFAVDELSGFISACARVRPTGIEGLRSKSVRKKLKQPSFAAKVDREQIRRGIEELGVEENEHIQLVIDAMAERAPELGLEPPS
jgi:predicted hydrolase (HD superfamily)